jgi:hypothetical protein
MSEGGIGIRTARISLWVLLAPASLIALEYLIVGLTFGFNLWRLNDLRPTLFWIAVVSFPFLLVVGLQRTRRSSRASLCLALGAWLYVIVCVWGWSRLV